MRVSLVVLFINIFHQQIIFLQKIEEITKEADVEEIETEMDVGLEPDKNSQPEVSLPIIIINTNLLFLLPLIASAYSFILY